MTTVTDWSAGFLSALTAGMSQFFNAIPYIIGALLILAIGWIVAGWAGMLVTKLAHAIKVDAVGDRTGVNQFLKKSGTPLQASGIFGEIVKWVIRLVFVEMAAAQLGMAQVTAVINQILAFIPNVVVAILILGVGAFLGQVLGGLARGFSTESRVGNPELVARFVNIAILAFAVIAALNQLQIAAIVVNTLYIGLVATLTIALGLAFGLGGRDTAARYTERWTSGVERSVQIPRVDGGTTTGTVVTADAPVLTRN